LVLRLRLGLRFRIELLNDLRPFFLTVFETTVRQCGSCGGFEPVCLHAGFPLALRFLPCMGDRSCETVSFPQGEVGVVDRGAV
jgi:hypothetical protein